jgi:hypothetical protein
MHAVLLCVALLATEPEALKKQYEEARAAEIARIATYADRLEAAYPRVKKGRVTGNGPTSWGSSLDAAMAGNPVTFRDAKQKKETIARVKREAEERRATADALKANPAACVPQIEGQLAVGKVGALPAPVVISQIAGPSTMIVEAWTDANAGDVLGVKLILHGISTTNLADGQKITLPRPIAITGTKQYTTVLGAGKTVLVAEIVPE